MTQYYFTQSNEYGIRDTLPDNATGWMIIPTDHWTPDMWSLMHSSNAKYELASHFSINVHNMSNGKCKECKLNTDQLTGQWLVGQDIAIDYTGWATNVSKLAEQGIL
jgi:hypothetical protein